MFRGIYLVKFKVSIAWINEYIRVCAVPGAIVIESDPLDKQVANSIAKFGKLMRRVSPSRVDPVLQSAPLTELKPCGPPLILAIS